MANDANRRSKTLSITSVAVLKAVADGYCYGFDVMDVTGLPSGTVYPILARLEEAGLLRSHWEKQEIAQKGKRPPRRYYAASAAGARELAAAVDYYRTLGGLVPLESRVAPSRSRG